MRYALWVPCGILLSSILLAGRPGTTVAEVEKQPEVRVSIAVTEGYGQAKKPVRVIIQNTSDKAQRHFEEWNSWGYGNLTAQWTDESGKSGTMTKIEMGWDKNYPSTVTLQPGDALVREITFDPKLWEHAPATIGQKLKLKVTYQSKPDRNVPVWVGTVHSAAREILLN